MVNDLAVDANGNVYVTGQYLGWYVTFATDTLSVGGLYIARYNSAGNPLWGKGAFGNDNTVSGQAITCDINGTVYAAGNFNGSFLAFDTLIYGYNTGTFSSSDFFITKLDNTTGIIQTSNSGTPVLIYPNPFSNELKVESLLFKAEPLCTIKIVDMFGREIYSQTNTTSNLKLQTSNWRLGMYLLTIQNKKGIVSRVKVIRQ